jgi:hypothetical protein
VAVITLLVVGPGARPAAAQVSFGVGGLYATLSGDDFQDTNAGFGLDGQVRFRAGSGFSIGAGAQWTTHSVVGIDPNWSVIGVFGEPRYEFAAGDGTLRPYLWGRGGWIRARIADGPDELTQNGFYVGGGGGLVIAAGGMASLDVGVLLAAVNFGEQQFNGQGTGFKPSGSSLALRAGLLVGGR